MGLIKISNFLFMGCFFAALLIMPNAISRAGQIKILIEPSPIAVAPGQSVKLRVKLVNLPANTRVKWSLDAVGVPNHQTGKLNQDFMPVYTAPNNPPSKPVYVQILALGATEGIPLAGAKSRIKFISDSAGGGGDGQSSRSSSGGGQGSQNSDDSGGGLGKRFGGNKSLGSSNPKVRNQQLDVPRSSGGSSSGSSGSSGTLWNSPSNKSKSVGSGIIWNSPSGGFRKSPSTGSSNPTESEPPSSSQWN